jgi:dTDP-4-dehydrorhamnose 3,5-epimerase
MYFQLAPHDHEKLVYVTSGEIVDVVVDLRKESFTCKDHISVNLFAKNKTSLFIPRGLAHGFKVLEDNTTVVYSVSTEYDNTADEGIIYDSIGFDLGILNPFVSERDKSFEKLNKFKSTF